MNIHEATQLIERKPNKWYIFNIDDGFTMDGNQVVIQIFKSKKDCLIHLGADKAKRNHKGSYEYVSDSGRTFLIATLYGHWISGSLNEMSVTDF